MTPRGHQVTGAAEAIAAIRKDGYAYLAWQERTGKTLTAILTAEDSKAQTILVVTKKKAISGWTKTLDKFKHTKNYTVINYESLHTIPNKDFDFIILDEAHYRISGVKRSETWKIVRRYTMNKPILYLSATPYAEHVGLLYNQLALSDYSPFKVWPTFNKFYKRFGIPDMIWTPYGMKDSRTKYKTDEVLELVNFNFNTRANVNIRHEPIVNLITLPVPTKLRNYISQLETGVVMFGDTEVIIDSVAKRRTIHYQLEGGVVKIDKEVYRTGYDKVRYILDNYDTSDIAIMAHFIGERRMLKALIPDALVLSSDGDAEGVDLSHVDKLIIYSMSFRTSKYTQRLARQANFNRTKAIVVDILVMNAPCIGADIYKSVAVKNENFTAYSYGRICHTKVRTK